MAKRSFGFTKEGKEAFLYTLENGRGMKAGISDYGANLVSLWAPDARGQVKDVALGFDSVTGYEDNPSFLGALIAPNANRIAGAAFSLEGEDYLLKKNNGENNLHSDEERGAHKRFWTVAEEKPDRIVLHLELEHGDMGFPGDREFQVVYALNEENELSIHYRASSDRNTLINPTNHSYFNLKGAGEGSIEDHRLLIKASAYTPTNAASIPTGEIAPVEATPMDLRREILIGEGIDGEFEQLRLAAGYDHNWVTDDCSGKVRHIATLKSPDGLRVMEVCTDLPGVQFYSGNLIEEQTGKGGLAYGKRSGLCLETQFYPDSPHHAGFPSAIFGPGRPYRSTTLFRFL